MVQTVACFTVNGINLVIKELIVGSRIPV